MEDTGPRRDPGFASRQTTRPAVGAHGARATLPIKGPALTPDNATLKHPLRPRVVKRAQFSPHISVGTICRPHSSCVLSTLTFAHSTIRPHTRLTTTTPPFDLTHCLLPISRCALHLVPPTDTLPILILVLIPIVPLLVLNLDLRFCGHQAQCSRLLTSFAPLFIVRFFSFLDYRGANVDRVYFATIALVFLWSIICLAIAAHFQSVLSPSDLSASYLRG